MSSSLRLLFFLLSFFFSSRVLSIIIFLWTFRVIYFLIIIVRICLFFLRLYCLGYMSEITLQFLFSNQGS